MFAEAGRYQRDSTIGFSLRNVKCALTGPFDGVFHFSCKYNIFFPEFLSGSSSPSMHPSSYGNLDLVLEDK